MTTTGLREIDAEIAEKVMGWEPGASDNQYLKEGGEFFVLEDGHVIIGKGEPGNYCTAWFSPSEHDADAMAVLRKCHELCIVESGTNGADVFFVRSAHYDIDESAHTLPLAICKFALKLFV